MLLASNGHIVGNHLNQKLLRTQPILENVRQQPISYQEFSLQNSSQNCCSKTTETLFLILHIVSLMTNLDCNCCIWQVFDLQYASPATVSRCGMVYVDPKNLGYLPFWQKWVNSRTAKIEKDNLQRLYDKYVPTLVDMVVEGIVDGRQGEKMKTIVPLTNLNMVSFSLV